LQLENKQHEKTSGPFCFILFLTLLFCLDLIKKKWPHISLLVHSLSKPTFDLVNQFSYSYSSSQLLVTELVGCLMVGFSAMRAD